MPATRIMPTSLGDAALTQALRALAGRERAATVEFIRHIAEFDARRLWAPAGFPSMHEYCVRELRLSDQATFKRIRAARLARRFPRVMTMLEDGRLHLSGVVVLNKHVTESNADELLEAATHKTRDEIEALIAARFPRPDVPTRVRALPAPTPAENAAPALALSPGTVDAMPVTSAAVLPPPIASAAHVAVSPPRVTPLAPQRFALQVTIAQETRDKLRRAQELLGFAVGPNEVAEVLDRALDALLERLEKRRGATHVRPVAPRAGDDPRHVPAHVQRAVWQRDGGQCTYTNESGQRCGARVGLELDHIVPIARGGGSTLDNLRLLCRAHNRLAAEAEFGAAFMAARIEMAREGRVAGSQT
jgi:5-methylcytosine-specific restriction endonuclease McrA